MKAKFILPLIAIAAVSLLNGCKEDAKTKSWYKENPTALETVYADCMKSGDDNENCRNAIEAHHEIKQANAEVPTFK